MLADGSDWDMNVTGNNTETQHSGGQGAYHVSAQFYINSITVPLIGLLGVVGNLLNLTILTWRSWRRDDDSLEKVALVGLIALAASDMCFCLTILPSFCYWGPQSLYSSKSFGLYYRLYGEYVQNVFMKTSTWLTMIVATARYIVICHPLRARMCFGLLPTRIAILFTFVFWLLFLSPLLWTFTYLEYRIGNTTMYIMDLGTFSNDLTLKMTFTYMWAILGYFVPVVILAFCNVCLILALRESRILRESVVVSRSYANTHKCNRRITITLIALVMMFMILISPSEILHFCNSINKDQFPALELGILFTNVLQAINFAFHFVLYCVVNVSFRRTLYNLFYMLAGMIRTTRLKRVRRKESYSHRSTFIHSALRSNETNI